MATKIKVDPRTFKIINQHQNSAQNLPQLESTTTTNSFTSDSESSTSVNSVADVKVIKLDTSVQDGGQRPPPINSEVKIQQPVNTVAVKPVPTNTTQPKTENNNDNNLYKYLSVNNISSNTSKSENLGEVVESATTTHIEEQSENENENEEK